LRYPLPGVGKAGRKLFPDIEAEEILRSAAAAMLDWWDEWRERPFTDTEEELILELDAALEQYQEQLAERVRRLEATDDPEAPDKGGSGPDLLLAVVTS